MAEMKHTPGPWKAGPPATGMDPYAHRYVHAGGELVASVSAGYAPDRRLEKDLDANARLIAEAPELLRVLLQVMKLIEDGVLVRDTSRDGESGWALAQLPLVTTLRDAAVVIIRATEGQA